VVNQVILTVSLATVCVATRGRGTEVQLGREGPDFVSWRAANALGNAWGEAKCGFSRPYRVKELPSFLFVLFFWFRLFTTTSPLEAVLTVVYCISFVFLNFSAVFAFSRWVGRCACLRNKLGALFAVCWLGHEPLLFRCRITTFDFVGAELRTHSRARGRRGFRDVFAISCWSKRRPVVQSGIQAQDVIMVPQPCLEDTGCRRYGVGLYSSE